MPSSTGPSIDAITEGGRVTQVGEGQEAEETSPAVVTFGAPTVGELLAERYELVEHINNDSAGRLVWRGVDVVLRRPVAVVLRYPGGDSATEMLQAAVAASRVIHPNLVGVYDAIDEDDRAYVVREWVDGQSLREMVAADGPLDPARATAIGNAVASALAAVHATGMVHGNLHPGTVMISDDGRVVLADARTDGADSQENDLRAVGGVLYFALTGHWPHGEAPLHGATAGHGRAALPDAVRDAGGAIAAPRQMRAGVPAYLDDLTMDLLDAEIPPPSSDVLAAELSRLDIPADEQFLEQAGPLRFTAEPGEEPSPLAAAGGRKVAIGIAGLLAVALVGLLIGINALGGGDDGDKEPVAQPSNSAPATGGGAEPAAQVRKLTIQDVRIIDPDGDRAEVRNAEKVIDGNDDEGWETNSYRNNGKFGGLKKGMGVWIDLGAPHTVKQLEATLSATGATVELRTGARGDFPSSSSGDKQLVNAYSTLIGPANEDGGTKMIFNAFEPDQKYQYLLFWITKLPAKDSGNSWKLGVQEIVVQGS
ncbi:protein kinase family protein [Micromonospora aurantiaca]|uniref:protein kinase family protein n=1 Tax=Micromonospora TaxID=1873 RepID=UPI00059F1041|nr:MULTISPECIES: protein kinase family protein [Micromonospora]MBC9000876.1 protein kinase family protein [Micromonospora aurantiaca]OHX05026.1 serine/threonine protein kinase [Micromonospora sp. WMMB235]